jgi:hypothetical protein
MSTDPSDNLPRRLILPPPVARQGTDEPDTEGEILGQLAPGTILMMGDNPRLPAMPQQPQLLDFFKHRITDITFRHLLSSAKRALDAGQHEKIVLACLLHDISNGCLLRSDHGYWGAQMIAPYVDEEVAWAVQNHQALRYFADESVGYKYPESYVRFFGPDYTPPDYIRRDAESARKHRWYMSSRLITLYDIYFFEKSSSIDPEIFTDIIGCRKCLPMMSVKISGSMDEDFSKK